jgi:hypothetical protein
MPALAYLFPPLSGLCAYALGRTGRARWHGLQSVVLGALWPASMYLGSWAGPFGSRIAFALGLLVWLGFLVLTAAGLNPRLPGGRWLLSLVDQEAKEESADTPRGNPPLSP